MRAKKEIVKLKLLRQIYFARTAVNILIIGCLIVSKSYDLEVNHLYLYSIIFILFVSPHVIFQMHRSSSEIKLKRGFEQIEYRAALLGNILFGACIPLVFFNPLLTFILVLIPYANLLTIGGPSLLKKGFLLLPLGVFLSTLICGVTFHLDTNIYIYTLGYTLLTSYIGSILYINYINTVKFNRTKIELERLNILIKEEKDKSESLLLNILPASVAEELKANGKAEARDFDKVTIIFTDFKEFTTLSEQMGAKRVVEEMNHCFKAFDAICHKYKVEKIKTIGDSYMAAGGLIEVTNSSVIDSVMAGIEMAQFIIDRKGECKKTGKTPFEMRTGLHTGNVVAGIIGVKKFQYDIWGDTVNTASRLESHGEVERVNISRSTYELVKNCEQFVFEHRGRVEAKGKGEIDMYFVSLA